MVIVEFQTPNRLFPPDSRHVDSCEHVSRVIRRLGHVVPIDTSRSCLCIPHHGRSE